MVVVWWQLCSVLVLSSSLLPYIPLFLLLPHSLLSLSLSTSLSPHLSLLPPPPPPSSISPHPSVSLSLPLSLPRNLALIGGLVLLLAEASGEAKTMFAGLPSMGGSQRQSYMQLAGRLLVIFMFLSLLRLELSPLRLAELVIGGILICCVAVGYKTKLSALILVLWLTALNFLLNSFWLVPTNRIMRDFLKYDFFQTFSVIGGLLFVVALGPGGVSLDEHKKQF